MARLPLDRPRLWPLSVRLLALLSAVGLPQRARCKLQTGMVRIGAPRKDGKVDGKWKYLSKFGYAVGAGNYSVRLKLSSPKTMTNNASLTVSIYLDEDWDRVEANENYCERPGMAKQTREVQLLANSEWGEAVSGTLKQTQRPHIWYFAISDCNFALSNYTHRLKFEFRANQHDGSEFSVEMRWMPSVNFLMLSAYVVFMWFFWQKAKAFKKSAGKLHPVIWTLATALILQLVGQFFHTVHLMVYRGDGSGIKAFEVLADILFVLSQIVQTALLILIGLGYTVLQSKIGELDLMIPVAFMIGIIQIMLVGFGKLKDDAAYKFHENEGVVGWILLVIRVLLYIWFLWAVWSSGNEGTMNVQRFYSKFRNAGTVYFLMYPFVFLLTKLFAPYVQHVVMTVGMMVMQMGSNVWLASLFLTRGDYFKVSTLSDSELPGGFKLGIVKEE